MEFFSSGEKYGEFLKRRQFYYYYRKNELDKNLFACSTFCVVLIKRCFLEDEKKKLKANLLIKVLITLNFNCFKSNEDIGSCREDL